MKNFFGRLVTSRILFAVAGFAVFNLIWSGLALVCNLKSLPGPLTVYAGLPKAVQNDIVMHLWSSLGRVLVGVSVSMAVALPAGIALGRGGGCARFFNLLLYFSYPIPKLALLPVILVLAGIGDFSKILLMMLIIMPQMCFSVRDAARSIPEGEFDVLKSLKASFCQQVVHLVLPSVLPAAFSALRVSIGIAFSALFFTETFGASSGLGCYVVDRWMRLDYPQMYLGIVILSLCGVVLFVVADVLQRLSCPWQVRRNG